MVEGGDGGVSEAFGSHGTFLRRAIGCFEALKEARRVNWSNQTLRQRTYGVELEPRNRTQKIMHVSKMQGAWSLSALHSPASGLPLRASEYGKSTA